MDFTLEFISFFGRGIYLCLPLLAFLGVIIVILGQIAGKMERWSRFDALYWSFITALTIGYGEIHPLRKGTKILSVLIGLAGFMFTGIIVAITVHTATKAFQLHVVAQDIC